MHPNNSPPTIHVLRPHHLDLLTIFVLVFKEFELRPLPPLFLLHIYRLLLNEVSEVTQPKSRKQLVTALISGPKSDEGEARAFISGFKSVHKNLTSVEQLSSFFSSLPGLFFEKSDDEPATLLRRSLFGYFCRRCFVSFLKLSFSGVVKLGVDYQAWCNGNYQAGYEVIMRDQMDEADRFVFKTRGDHKTWAQPNAFEMWQKGQLHGDENVAVENLRRFFEQVFHENSDSALRQQALLHLVRMHYVRNEFAAAREMLTEAIQTSRTLGDKFTLQHCMSMLHRLPPPPDKKPTLNEIQPYLEPLEVLFDVSKLLDPRNEQPITASFIKIAQSLGLYDQWLATHRTKSVEDQQWAFHAVQSTVWETAGCSKLSEIEEQIVIAFTNIGGDDNNRITSILNFAYRNARQGHYEESLVMLLDPDVWRGLTMEDYGSWAQEVWHILALRASRRGQTRLYHEYLMGRRPAGDYHSRYYLLKGSVDCEESADKIIRPLYKMLLMRECDQAAHGIEQLLSALWHSEFLLHFFFYRAGIILLADVGLEFGMSKQCQRILEDIMPQVIVGNDVEQRALASFTLARCLITSDSLDSALYYLNIAEKDFLRLEMYTSLMDVQYLTWMLHNTIGNDGKAKELAERHIATRDKRNALETVDIDDEVVQILDIIANAGAALACRS